MIFSIFFKFCVIVQLDMVFRCRVFWSIHETAAVKLTESNWFTPNSHQTWNSKLCYSIAPPVLSGAQLSSRQDSGQNKRGDFTRPNNIKNSLDKTRFPESSMSSIQDKKQHYFSLLIHLFCFYSTAPCHHSSIGPQKSDSSLWYSTVVHRQRCGNSSPERNTSATTTTTTTGTTTSVTASTGTRSKSSTGSQWTAGERPRRTMFEQMCHNLFSVYGHCFHDTDVLSFM